MLRFWGRGSAFSAENNSAFFVDGNDLILLDFPMSSLHKLIGSTLLRPSEGGPGIRQIYILVTHTHSDHIGGIPMLIHYAFYVLGRLPVTVVAPSPAVAEDLLFYIDRLEGCDKEGYSIITADALKKWDLQAIPTSHTPQLEGRCFGYCLTIENTRILYTGDTNTLKPFYPFLEPNTILYTEIASSKSPVHLSVDDSLKELLALSEKGIQIRLMHLDDEEAIKKAISKTDLKLADLSPDA